MTSKNIDENIHSQAKEYYGKTLKGTDSLKTNSCTCSERPPKYIVNAISLIHDDIKAHYYGCGLVIPNDVEGLTCLDLGCGAGRDVYILSKLVGEKGKIIGVDMTQEQLDLAEKYKEYHREKFGYKESNVKFIKGFIESLEEIPTESVDLIISNCVVNLSPNKNAVLSEAYRVLKKGGEMYFSDVYSDRRIPDKLLKDPVLHGECLSGALYWNDFLHIAKNVGFKAPRLVKDRKITINNKDIESKIGFANFYSATYRLFKIDELEEDSEDYGQKIIYKGTIKECPDSFVLDCHYTFEKLKEYPVCRNTFKILEKSRFSKHFEFKGNDDIHYGIFRQYKPIPFYSAYNFCCPSQKKECCSNSKSCC